MQENSIVGTIYQFKIKIKICVTKSKKLNSDVSIRENVKNRCQKNWKIN